MTFPGVALTPDALRPACGAHPLVMCVTDFSGPVVGAHVGFARLALCRAGAGTNYIPGPRNAAGEQLRRRRGAKAGRGSINWRCEVYGYGDDGAAEAAAMAEAEAAAAAEAAAMEAASNAAAAEAEAMAAEAEAQGGYDA